MSINTLIFSSYSIWGILARFVINLIFLFGLIWFIYFRYSKKERFLFTFFLIGIIVFVMSSVMKKFDINISLAFGLFAIFGILRLRTRNFSVKDMAYLFTVIGLSVINALGLLVYPFYGIVILNLIIMLSALFLELYVRDSMFKRQSVIYENLNLLRPENHHELIKDLTEMTGHHIVKTRVREVNFKNKIAKLDIYYRDKNKHKNKDHKNEKPEEQKPPEQPPVNT